MACLQEELLLAGHLWALAQSYKAVGSGDFGQVRQGQGSSGGRVRALITFHEGKRAASRRYLPVVIGM